MTASQFLRDATAVLGQSPVRLNAPAMLPALGDMLDAVPRSIKAFNPSIVGDGVTDQTSKLITALSSGAKNIIFPPDNGAYVIDGRVRLYSGQKVSGLHGASFLQKQKYMQTFDAQGADELIVQGLTFKGSYALTYDTDFSERGDNHSAQSCAIWANGSRVTVRDCHFEGLTVGVWFIPFDITANALVGQGQDNRLFDSTFKNVSFGVLAKRQDDMQISRLRGRDILLSAGSPNEQHLIYVTGYITDRSNNVQISDIIGNNVPAGTLVQVKWTDGLQIKNVTARNAGVLTLVNTKHFNVSGLEGYNCEDCTGTGAVKVHPQANDMTTKCEDGLISGVKLHMKSGSTRSLSIASDRVTVRDTVICPNRTSSTSEGDIHIKGALNCDVEAKVVNGAFGSRAAIVDVFNSVNSDGNRIAVEANNALLLVRVTANQTNTRVEYDMNRSTLGTSGTALLDDGTGTSLRIAPKEVPVTAVGGGTLFGSSTDAIRGARVTRVAITVTDALAYTIGPPFESVASGTPVGTELKYIVINATAGALGTFTWNSAFKFKTSYAAPAAGKATSYTFRFDGTNWIEI